MSDEPAGAESAPSVGAYLLALYRWHEWPLCGGSVERPVAPRAAGAAFYCAAMSALSDWADHAVRHVVADEIMSDLARHHGHSALADLYESLERWYS